MRVRITRGVAPRNTSPVASVLIEDLEPRTKFYGFNLGQLGIPLLKAITPDLSRITFNGVPAGFKNDPAWEKEDPFATSYGFSTPRCFAEGCLGWTFCQWHLGTEKGEIRREIAFAVERGMEIQRRYQGQRYRCLHDLWILVCAILGSDDDQLNALAHTVTDAQGVKEAPRNDGELYAGAWCGMLKYAILQEPAKAAEHFALIWDAYRYDIAPAAPKSLAGPWLAGEWETFAKAQKKDFKNLWQRAWRDGIVVSEQCGQALVRLKGVIPGARLPWAHWGLAMLAHRRGIKVVTDPLWFPPRALEIA